MTKEKNLAEIAEGGEVFVRDVAGGGAALRRFSDLGFVAGVRVRALFRSPWGDPTAYLVKGAVIALRRADAKNIYVESAE